MTRDFSTSFSERARLYGDGRDGDVTVSGAVTLTSEKAYNNLTINGAGSLRVEGVRIYVYGTLDLTAAGDGAIWNVGADAGSPSGTVGGAGGAAMTGYTLPYSMNGATGGAGGAAGAVGSNGVTSPVPTVGQGGVGGQGGDGSAGTSS